MDRNVCRLRDRQYVAAPLGGRCDFGCRRFAFSRWGDCGDMDRLSRRTVDLDPLICIYWRGVKHDCAAPRDKLRIARTPDTSGFAGWTSFHRHIPGSTTLTACEEWRRRRLTQRRLRRFATSA